MSQATIVFGVLAVAFVIFITTRGELSSYLAVLFGKGTGAASGLGSLGSLGSTPATTPNVGASALTSAGASLLSGAL